MTATDFLLGLLFLVVVACCIPSHEDRRRAEWVEHMMDYRSGVMEENASEDLAAYLWSRVDCGKYDHWNSEDEAVRERYRRYVRKIIADERKPKES